MATWSIEQKTEVWWSTTVEADTFEEAMAIAQDENDWVRGEEYEWCDEFWGMNEDTTEQYSLVHGQVIKEE
jgi:hypothetical protein